MREFIRFNSVGVDLFGTLIKWVTFEIQVSFIYSLTQFVTQRAVRARSMNMTNQESEEKSQSERKEGKNTHLRISFPSTISP